MDRMVQNVAFFALVMASVAVPILVTTSIPKSATLAAGLAGGTTQPCRWPTTSFGSVGSTASIGSVGSHWSIGSIGSILSIGSVGSVLSIGSIGGCGTIFAVLGVLSIGGWFSVNERRPGHPWGIPVARRRHGHVPVHQN
ncbi:g6559 [Coccomyxa viridis]|uniref:G6559 protein n=1 Tax=Coccomyxa viridis TaxID=1274662 RepID=A0ABP1FVM6_9CHLO